MTHSKIIRRYIIDGAVGSGKTSLIFGKPEDSGKMIKPNLLALGLNCMTESPCKAVMEFNKEGLAPEANMKAWFEKMMQYEVENYRDAKPGVNIYDRSILFLEYIHGKDGIALPEWYDSANFRYDNPVFLLMPVESVDMTIGNETHPSKRKKTLEQRWEQYEGVKVLYRNKGYKIVEVPMFVEGNVARNNQERMNIILNHILKDGPIQH
ncbi:ATP-binding protein [Candidatus Micrarchaeota archaeon]|jgi:predicted ATPase|nr:ATP-binding protein [Candidatus Micrarchaeota archaeon]